MKEERLIEIGEMLLQSDDAEIIKELLDEIKYLRSVHRQTLNGFSRVCHEAAVKSGWWTNLATGEPLDRNKGELMMLMVSEIAEMMEGSRKNLMDDKLPDRRMEEVELADLLIRAFDYAGAFKFDLHGAVIEKLAFNANRDDHKIEHRLAEGGKKF